jgi:outer membrane protein insertion porin family
MSSGSIVRTLLIASIIFIIGSDAFMLANQEPEETVATSAQESASQAVNQEAEETIEPSTEEEPTPQSILAKPRRIAAIFVNGNKFVPTPAILNKIPYRVGEIFNPLKTRLLIHNLYYDLKRFRVIYLYGEPVGDDLINLYVEVEEKKPLKEITVTGNSAVSGDDLEEKLALEDIPAVDPEELKTIAQKIKKLYLEKGYFNAEINFDFKVDEEDRATVVFKVTEHTKSSIKRIEFIGNKQFTAKTLRSILYTHEDWLLGFLDRSGTYHPERLEADKQAVEHFYQSNGYLNAKVLEVKTDMDPVSKDFAITFDLEEGDLYTIKEVHAQGNDILPEEFLLANIPVHVGSIYSREKVIESIKALESLWGNLGYIFASIEPTIQPNDDDETVSIGFKSELGNKITLNKITIRGNKKTRDKIIRRALVISEGDPITTAGMEESKNRVQALGYFDQREGVNWKLTRISETEANLDLLLKEAHTGHAGFQLGFAGSERSIKEPLTGLSLELGLADTNIAGTGIKGNLMARLSHQDLTFAANVTQPWLFDRPILGALDAYHKRVGYEEFNFAQAMNEIDTGGVGTLGFVTRFHRKFLRDTFIRAGLGVDSIKYTAPPRVNIPRVLPEKQLLLASAEYQSVLNKEFDPGDFVSLNVQIGQEKRNHPMHPSSGYSWLARSIFAFSVLRGNLGFHKFDIDVHWYTSLINAFDLVFHIRGYLGIITTVGNRFVPYRELFHIGGPASVRGFLYGQIGPQFSIPNIENIMQGDSIGGTKTLFMNAELIFPILSDFSIKALVFYDGGTGWSNPYAAQISPEFLRNNRFSYRHSVGFGVRILRPVPARIDWGFKLDPQPGESAYEVHFNMSYDW